MQHPMLPYELVDIIIDYLHGDRVALAACCLVCKAWLASSRYHLFTDILLNHWNCDNILSLPAPSIFSIAARRLMLTDKDSLPPGIEQFSSIRAFYLRVSSPDADMLSRIPVIFPKITLLELNYVVFDSFEELIQLICATPCLETLSLCMCTWKHDLEQPLPSLHLPTCLHTLNILSLRLHFFLTWFNTLESPPPLTTLRVYRVGEEAMPSLGGTIKALGGSLQNLTLDLWDHNHADTLTDHVDLGDSARLHSFTLLNGWPKLLHRLLLTRTKPPALEDITLTIYEGKANIPNLDLLDWGGLDCLLTRDRDAKPGEAAENHRGRTRLTVRVYAHSLVSRVNQATVEGRFMPLCGARGMVRYVSERERVLGVRGRMRGPIALRSWGEEISS